MSGQPSMLDRAMRWVAPAAVRAFAPPPRPLSDGLWIVDRQVSLPPGRFERIIVTHGEIVEHDAGAELRRAFARSHA